MASTLDNRGHWGRAFEQLGHTVKLMHPKYVKPYVKTNKNDGSGSV